MPAFGAALVLAGGAAPVRLVSVGAADGGGPAVLSGGGGLDFTALTPAWLAIPASSRPPRAGAPVDVATACVAASDPPPRPV